MTKAETKYQNMPEQVIQFPSFPTSKMNAKMT